ncbi:protein O-mannosyl-transferase TMEM260 isoform X3 [Chanodichthys erythropterus]|uniref:protein O-mannosyl-transferase TMEM260 isoform X3 n=1 Tax=Chanodichthys erythropterus TaxID=933992 RepID=UPI00351EF385
MSSDKLTWTLTGATVACVLAVYVASAPRAVPGGDSGELITAACELGVAHPPGYPLFTMLSSLLLLLLPLSSPAHSINVLCAVFGAGASGGLCFTVCRLAGPGPGAVLAGGVFAVSRLVWQWSVVAEVFSLNNLFVGVLFSLSACFLCAKSVQQKKKFALWGALFCGLSLCNQHTLVLYVVIIIPWALLHLYTHNGLSFIGLVSLGTCFLAGFVPYIYLPISSYLNRARWSWGDQTSLHGFLTHLLRAEYGTFSLAKTDENLSLLKMLRAQWNHCVNDLSSPVLMLAVLGILLSIRSRIRFVFVWLIVTMVSIYSVFFAWRANLNIEKPLLLGVVERFWLQADAGVCVLAGLGLSWAVCWLNGRLSRGTVWNTGAWILTAGLISHMISLNHSFHPGSWERIANEEMWQARMKTAFFLFDLAENMEREQQARLYELSYYLYCQIVDAQVDYPANWDKNLALAAERLLQSGGRGYSLDSLLSRSIHHFSRYLHREPTDPQSKAIRSVITHLRKELDKLRDRQKG